MAKPIQERIKIIDNSDDEDGQVNGNLITLTLQGEEGRKSRVKFLVSKV